jgi:hypothetical protein
MILAAFLKFLPSSWRVICKSTGIRRTSYVGMIAEKRSVLNVS